MQKKSHVNFGNPIQIRIFALETEVHQSRASLNNSVGILYSGGRRNYACGEWRIIMSGVYEAGILFRGKPTYVSKGPGGNPVAKTKPNPPTPPFFSPWRFPISFRCGDFLVYADAYLLSFPQSNIDIQNPDLDCLPSYQ